MLIQPQSDGHSLCINVLEEDSGAGKATQHLEVLI